MIGIGLVATFDTGKVGLAAPVPRSHMPALGAGAAGVVRWHNHQMRPAPGQLVVELTPELVPALVEDRAVEARFLPDMAAWLLGTASGRARHVAYLQVFQHHERVVLADRGGSLVQVVAPGIGDVSLAFLDAGLGLLPVVAELGLATHGLLRLAQRRLVLPDTVEGCQVAAIGERSKPRHAHVDAHRAAGRRRHHDLALGLDRDEPSARRLPDRDVLDRSQHLTALAETQPAQLGQIEATVALVEFDLFRIGIAEAVALPFLLEAREVCTLGEEVSVGAIEILQRLLERVDRPTLEPWCFYAISPSGELLAQGRIPELLLTGRISLFLQRQRLVEHEPGHAGKLAHFPHLISVGHQFVFVGLEALHKAPVTDYLSSIIGRLRRTRYPSPH